METQRPPGPGNPSEGDSSDTLLGTTPEDLGSKSLTSKFQKIHRKRWLILAALLICLLLYFTIRWIHDSSAKRRAPASVPVVTAVVTKQDFPVYLSALGSVTPTYSI